MANPATPRETAGTTICLIVRYVRHHAGDDGVARLLELAGDDRPLHVLEDEQRWSTYEQKIALLEAAAEVLDDPDVALHIGETALDHSVGPGIRILLRRLGSPRVVLSNVSKASAKFSTVTDMWPEHIDKDFAVIRYRLHDPERAHRADCQLNIGFMRTIGVLFGMPPLTVEHPECQVLGAPACEYVVHWTKGRRRQRRRDAVLANQVDALEAQLALLQSTTADLVSSDDIDEVLARIVTSAGRAVSAPGYLLALYDTVEVTDRVHADGIDAADVDAVATEVLAGALGVGPSSIVIEVASSRQKYGRLAAFYDDHAFFAYEEGLLASYAQSAAAALDAATALDQARRRGAATAALLRLARALSEPASPRRIARIVAGAMTEILDVPAAAVMLWDDTRTSLRVAGRVGWPVEASSFIDEFQLPADNVANLAALLQTEGARIVDIDGTSTNPIVAELAPLGVPKLAVAPIRAHHGQLFGLAIAALTDAQHRSEATIIERLIAIGDQAATAVQNAELLEQIRHQAVHDNLTGLANRALFDEELDKTLARARRAGSPLTVLFVDLDDFKSINDRFGHSAGDHVLRTVGARLVAAGRQGDWVARLGGDEFTMLLPGAGTEEAGRIAARIRETVRDPIEVGAELLCITPSIGAASYPSDGTTAEVLMRCADRAMYRVKHTARVPATLSSTRTTMPD